MARSRRPKPATKRERQERKPATRKPPTPPTPATEQANDGAEPRMTGVGFGASAGGLDAFTQVLHALPADPGFAMVLVQHLAPQHESALANLLSMQTSLPVVQATDGMELEQNHIYVIPPNVHALMRYDG